MAGDEDDEDEECPEGFVGGGGELIPNSWAVGPPEA